jgi:hypothetical protein
MAARTASGVNLLTYLLIYLLIYLLKSEQILRQSEQILQI